MCSDYEKFFSQYELYDEITPKTINKNDQKVTRIYNAFHKETSSTRILKICEKNNLSTVCESLKKVRHPNVAVVYDYVYYNDDTYILEEKLHGCTLAEKLDIKGELSTKEVARIVMAVCDGLSVLHEKKPPIIHNDIKPSNIYICDDGNVKVFDFDISRTYKEKAVQNTVLMGTEDYASPEHHGFGGQTDQRSDIYSLGVTMHKMLSGRTLNEKRKTTYTGELSRIIDKCVQKEPDERYQSVKLLKKDLEKQISHKRGKLVATLCGVVLCGVLVFGVGTSIKKATNDKETKSPLQETDGSEFFTESNAVSTTEKSYKTTKPTRNDTKSVKVVSKLAGEVASMVSLNDGTIVYIESVSGECHIKTSAGIDKLLNVQCEDCHLLYNTYTDELYLLSDDGSGMAQIYSLDENFDIISEPLYSNSSIGHIGEFCSFFLSDGTLYCNKFYSELIDSEHWVKIGTADFSATTQFNDRMFYMNSYTLTEELGHGAESVSYDVPWDYLLDGKYCTTNEGIYFIAKTDHKDYIYKFDGAAFTELLCLNDYKYYTHSSYEKFGVTKDKIWLCDATANTIKELPIE